MSNDEKLLASSLIKSLAPFDMSLAWALCAKVFNDDKVRWNCCWFPWDLLSVYTSLNTPTYTL